MHVISYAVNLPPHSVFKAWLHALVVFLNIPSFKSPEQAAFRKLEENHNLFTARREADNWAASEAGRLRGLCALAIRHARRSPNARCLGDHIF